MKIRLHISDDSQDQDARVYELEFACSEILIGRDGECDVQIHSAEASRSHARITRESGVWFLRDAGSSLGTVLNDRRLQGEDKCALHEGDRIKIAQTRITVHLDLPDELEASFDDKTSVVAQRLVRGILEHPENVEPHLLVMNGKNQGQKISLNAQVHEFIIGRDKNADLCIYDEKLSRQHARIKREWHEWILEDLSSKNGVIVNGRRINTQTRLKNGDEIFLGSVHLTFFDPSLDDDEEILTPRNQDFHPEVPQSAMPSPSSTPSLPRVFGFVEVALGLFACTVLVTLIIAVMLWRG